MRALSIVFAILLIYGCLDKKDDDGGGDGGVASCDGMCAHFMDLECLEGEPFYDSDKPGPVGEPNTTCVEFCESQMALGVNLNTACAAQAPSCEEIEAYRAMTSCAGDAG